MLTEGVASINATAIFKGAPHPNAALLFARWVASQEGQKVMSAGRAQSGSSEGRTDGKDPHGEDLFHHAPTDLKGFPKYEKIWKEIFKLR